MKFNKKPSYLLAILLAASIAISGCGGKEERKAKHLEKSKAYYEQADYEKAQIELKNVLQIDPKSAEAYFWSGQIAERKQNWQGAFGSYMKAIELDPNHLAAKAKVGRLYLMSGETAKVEKMVSEILAKKPGDSAGHTLKAALLARKGDEAGAIKEVTQVVATDATQTDAVSLLAALYNKRENFAKAEEVLATGIKNNPKNVSLHMDMVAVAMKRNDMAKAEQQYRDIIALEPKNLEYRVAQASFLAQTKQLDKAEKSLRETIQADPEDEQRYLLLVEFLAAKRGGEVAEKELLKSIQTLPKAYKLRFGLAKLYMVTNKPDKALQIYRDIIDLDKIGKDALKARVLLARSQAESGKTAEAEKLIAEVLKENARDNDALLLRGQMALAKNHAQNAINDFRAVLKDQPDSVEVIGLLARAHMANKEPQLAKETFAKAVSLYPNNPNVRLAMADFLASSKDYDGALQEAEAAIAADPKNARALQARGEILVAKKDWPAAEQAMTKVKEALPDQPVGYYRLGQIYQVQHKFDQAAAEFEAALAKSPKSMEPLTALVNMLVTQNQADKAVVRLNAAMHSAPDNLAVQLLLGEVYMNQKKYAEADAVFRKVIQLNPKVPVPYMDMANLNIGRGDVKTAIQWLQQGLTALPEDERLSAMLAELYQRNGDYDKAIAQYESALKKNPAADGLANNLASLLTDTKGDKASLARALEIVKHLEGSSNPAFVDTLGWTYYKLGQYDLALPLLQKAVDLAPQYAVFQYHLGMVFHKKGDVKSAKVHLQKAVENPKAQYPGIEEAKAILSKG